MARTIDTLVEREVELARIDAALGVVVAGSGCLVVVEGPAGIGKSSLLEAARARGQARGLQVLSATAGEFERELGFSVVRQLFEPALHAVTERERRRLLTGAAGLVRPLLMPSMRTADARSLESAAIMHGLYWLTANLAERRPLLLCADDAQWGDLPSLGSLVYLARRLADLGVLLIVAVRSGEPEARGGQLAALTRAGTAERLVLAPLSLAGSARLVQHRWPSGIVDDELSGACHEVTGGNPFFLRELVRAIDAEHDARGTELLDRVRRLTPPAVSRAVILRLSRLSLSARALATALAVLGGRAELRELLALAELDQVAGAEALDALERDDIAGERPVRFIHPLVGAAIYGELSPARRSLEHARAARVLAAAGIETGRVASHLVQVDPAGDASTVGILREAARDAAQRGATDEAVSWLGRALAEPPGPDECAAVLHELGVAELRAGAVAGDAGRSRAEVHLAAAVEGLTDPRAKALAGLDLGDAIWARHDYAGAVEAFDRAIGAVVDADGELALRIEAHAAAAGSLDLGTCGLASRRLERFDEAPGETPAAQLIAGVLAIQRSLAGEPAHQVVALAEQMLDDGHLPSDQVGAQIPLFVTNALLWSDRSEHAQRLLDEMIATARADGAVRRLVVALCWRGHAAHRSGALAEAAGDLATAVEVSTEEGLGDVIVTRAMLADALVDRGDIGGAHAALARVRVPDQLPDYIGWNYFVHARGSLHAAEGDFNSALEDFLVCGARQQRWGAHNPSVIAWRSQAALAHLALNQREQAIRLAREELLLARRAGTPRAIGIAMRSLALAEPGERRTTLLREAVATLEGSQARLEHARALNDLGGALRRANQRASARSPLREALELATRCGATPLAERARNELAATGARPRKLIRTGLDALTPVERQAANMAAQGMSNPQIGQALFISRKTVEKRLSEAYRKLEISSRTELAQSLAIGAPSSGVVAPDKNIEGGSP